MNYSTEIDHKKALLLMEASIQAYNAFSDKSPAQCQKDRVVSPVGYDFVECWSGIDSIFSHVKRVECYGIVLRSKQAPYTYVFAFRGTDSIMDLIDDLGAEHTSFIPYKAGVEVPSDVLVESGFFDVYHQSNGKTPSMQRQLFSLLKKYQASDKPIEHLYITGHSLGAAVCQLFTLDLALSMPDIQAINYNYASPRVGNAGFVRFYEQQPSQQSQAGHTIRIQNIYDKVPCVPPEDLGYQHTVNAYLVAFFKDTVFNPNFIIDNHSALHYQAVLQCAFESANGICVDKCLKVAADAVTLTSEKPNIQSICTFW